MGRCCVGGEGKKGRKKEKGKGKRKKGKKEKGKKGKGKRKKGKKGNQGRKSKKRSPAEGASHTPFHLLSPRSAHSVGAWKLGEVEQKGRRDSYSGCTMDDWTELSFCRSLAWPKEELDKGKRKRGRAPHHHDPGSWSWNRNSCCWLLQRSLAFRPFDRSKLCRAVPYIVVDVRYE